MGNPLTITWRAENRTQRPLHLRIGDELAPSLGAESRRCALLIGPATTASAHTESCPSRRGRFTPRHVIAEVRGPLGLVWRTHHLDVPTQLAVHPVFASRAATELRLRQSRAVENGSRRTRGGGTGTEFLQLRDYSPDDQFSRIDWAATARRGRPVVRTYHREQNQTVVVVLDSGRMMAVNVDGTPRFEHAVDATRSLAALTSELGDRIGLITFDDRVATVLQPRCSASNRHGSSTRSSTCIRASSRATTARRSPRCPCCSGKRCLIVLLTELSPAADATGLFEAIPILTRRHRVLIGTIRDPAIPRWADERPADVAEAFRSAAAAHGLGARRERILHARRLGATVVDSEPGQLASALGDAYLSIKSDGSL